MFLCQTRLAGTLDEDGVLTLWSNLGQLIKSVDGTSGLQDAETSRSGNSEGGNL